MTDKSFTLTIPATPPSGNQYTRLHWRERDKLTVQWGLLVGSSIQGKAWFGRAKVEAVFYFKESRTRDIPNFMVTLDKLIIDHLKGRIIPDDNSDILPEWTVRFEVDKASPRTEVTLTAM